jgi:hypothetical protein
MLVPTKLRNSVCVRDNVETNLLSLTKRDRRELWRSVYKLTKSNLFHTTKALDQRIKLSLGEEIMIYGAIIRSSFMAIVKIVKQKLFILSVICKRRLLESVSFSPCVIVNDVYQSGPLVLRVFSGVDHQKNVVWKWEGRHQGSNAVFSYGGEMVSFSRRAPKAA